MKPELGLLAVFNFKNLNSIRKTKDTKFLYMERKKKCIGYS